MYAGLRTFLSVKVTILLQLVVPVVLLLSYLLLLTKTAKIPPSQAPVESGKQRVKFKIIRREEAGLFLSHLKYIPRLAKFMVPLYLVYISEYMINHSLFELLYYPHTSLGQLCFDQQAQYRW